MNNMAALFVVLLLAACKNEPACPAPTVAATSSVQEGPKVACLRNRSMHVHGTYKVPGGQFVDIYELPIDLTVDECLEWGYQDGGR